MEPSYDFSDKSWYKPKGQTQTVRMRRTSATSPNTTPSHSPSGSPPTSRTGTFDSDSGKSPNLKDGKRGRGRGQKLGFGFTKVPLPPPPPPVHPKSIRAKFKDGFVFKATPKATPTPTPIPKSNPKSKPKSKSQPQAQAQAQPTQPTTPDRDLYYYDYLSIPAPTSPPSSFSSAYSNSRDSMCLEKSLLPKRALASESESESESNSKPHTHKSKPKPKPKAKAKAEHGRTPSASRGITHAATLYVKERDNELAPKGSWYFPRGSIPKPTSNDAQKKQMRMRMRMRNVQEMKKLESEDDESGCEGMEEMKRGRTERKESGVVKLKLKCWYRAFRRRVRLDA